MEFFGRFGIDRQLDEESEFLAHRLAENDGWRELGAGRNVGHLRGIWFLHAIDQNLGGAADLDSADELLGNKHADFHISRREEDDDRLAGIDPIAFAVERVRNKRRLLGKLFFFRKVPLGPLQSGLLGEEVLLGGADLVGAGAELGGDERGLELGDALFVFVAGGAGKIEVALRSDICGEEFFLPVEFDFRES